MFVGACGRRAEDAQARRRRKDRIEGDVIVAKKVAKKAVKKVAKKAAPKAAKKVAKKAAPKKAVAKANGGPCGPGCCKS